MIRPSTIAGKWILPIIVFAQFCCTALWFAGNAVLPELITNFQLSPDALAHLTSAVQFGFISGTLIFAFLTLADRFSPSLVFWVCACFGAAFNLGITLPQNDLMRLLLFRFLTGFCLAGIYPVGMKIAADYYQKGLGKSLGFLVGALVVGTAFPHLLKGLATDLPWRVILYSISILSVLGGTLLLVFVPDGPYRKPSLGLDFSALFKVFRNPAFRSAALGYFGHMWELYAFWAFVPILLLEYTNLAQGSSGLNPSILAFFIIGLGGLACVAGAFLAAQKGTQKTAAIALFLSGSCCLVAPFIFRLHIEILTIFFLLFWGLVVIADSPLFSTLVAQHAPAATKGTALTIVNCIGFSVTIISIQLLNYLKAQFDSPYIYMVLALGPILGLLALYRKASITKK
ncbi:MAG: nitrate/nitrite transporter [Saprospiraceae bacterium]